MNPRANPSFDRVGHNCVPYPTIEVMAVVRMLILRNRALLLLLAVVAVLGGCDWSAALPPEAVRMTPPAIYYRWWALIEACSGRPAPFSSIRWYRVPGATVMYKGVAAAGYYTSDGVIVLTDSIVDYGAGVRHEMLHAVLRSGGHPRAQFLGSCADVVDCRDQCAREAGAWSSPAPFVPLPAESLIVTARAELLPPESDGQRWLTLRVVAQNPKPRAVLVVPYGTRFSWGRSVNGAAGGFWSSLPVADSSNLFFNASAAREFLFEFRVAAVFTKFTLPPGDYFLRGAFGQHWSDGIQFTVAQ